jgi:hypothetical protein
MHVLLSALSDINCNLIPWFVPCLIGLPCIIACFHMRANRIATIRAHENQRIQNRGLQWVRLPHLGQGGYTECSMALVWTPIRIGYDAEHADERQLTKELPCVGMRTAEQIEAANKTETAIELQPMKEDTSKQAAGAPPRRESMDLPYALPAASKALLYALPAEEAPPPG